MRAVAIVIKCWEHKYVIQFVLLISPVSSGYTLTIRNIFCRPYSEQEIVKRAKSKLGEQGYNILFQNCEHFVTWCRYGKESSQQVRGFFSPLSTSSWNPFMELVQAMRNETNYISVS